MEFFTTEEIMETYNKVRENITQEQVDAVSKLMGSIVNNISLIIGNYIKIHEKMYKVSKVYREFVDCIFKDNQKGYHKLLSVGAARQGINTANSLRSLGLFSLTRKIFRVDDKSVEKKAIEFFCHIEPVMEMYVEANESNLYFPCYFFTVEVLKGIVLEELNKILENYKF